MAKPLLLGIEIGGTKLQLGLGHGDGRLLGLRRVAVEPAAGAAGILEQVRREANHVAWGCDTTLDKVEAVGIGFGGPVDAGRGVVTRSFQVEGWENLALADWARETLGVAAVALENDADTAGLGEARFGAGAGRSPLLYVTVGSGIGGGLILDGAIYRGAGRGAAEVGHLRVGRLGQEEGPHWAELEELASGWSIAAEGRRLIEASRAATLADLVDGDPSQVTAEVVAMAASLGDEDARWVLDRAVAALAFGLSQAVALLGPRRIILGGGVSRIGEEGWLSPIRRELDLMVFPPFRGSFDVVAAKLGEEVVVHGALALARDALAARLQ
jgi:glucokinase